MKMPSRDRLLNSLPILVVLVVALILPFVLQPFWVDRITGWIPIAIGALGLNLLTGYNGQISVGHGALYGLGAYAGAILVADGHWPLVVAVVGAAAVCFVVGALIGVPALRIKGLYLALVTLAVATLFPELVKAFESITGGLTGYEIKTMQMYRGKLRPRPMQWEPPEGLGLAEDQWRYLVYLVIAVVCFILVRNLVNSRFGRAMVAIRDNEIAAETNGVNVPRTKVVTFGIASALAGVGGALFAFKEAQVFPGSFTLAASLTFMVAVVIGGPATITGPIIGAISLGIFEDVITENLDERLKPATPLILGALLILMMLVSPGGIAGTVKAAVAKARYRTANTAISPDASGVSQ
jgi:branched-chain amino acid transport system permease protein